MRWTMMAVLAVAAAAAPAVARTIGTVTPTISNSPAAQTAIPAAADADQTSEPGDDALQPIGAHFGSFFLYPKIETSLLYNDNIYALQHKTDDEIARISPSLDLQGNFGPATTDVRASLDRYQYFHNTDENRTDWSLGANGQFEVTHDRFGYLAGGFSHAHEDRGDPNAIYTSRRPTSYYLGEAGLGFSSEATRLHYGLDASYRGYNFQNGRQIGGDTINNNDRDRAQYRVAGRIGYEFSPGYTILARTSYERVAYDRTFNDAGYRRSSSGYRATIGLQFDLTNLLSGEVFAGYLKRDFDDPRYPDIKRPVFGSSLIWTPDPLVTVTLDGDRTVQETIAFGYSSFFSTNVALGATYKLRRTVTLEGKLRYGRDAYGRQSGVLLPHRHDDNFGISVGGKYQLNRTLYTGLSYDWTYRNSNVSLPGYSFDRNRVTASIGVQL